MLRPRRKVPRIAEVAQDDHGGATGGGDVVRVLAVQGGELLFDGVAEAGGESRGGGGAAGGRGRGGSAARELDGDTEARRPSLVHELHDELAGDLARKLWPMQRRRDVLRVDVGAVEGEREAGAPEHVDERLGGGRGVGVG